MTQHNQRHRLWQCALALGGVLLLSRPALAQVAPPATVVPLPTFSIMGKASSSETQQTSAADYTVTFTLAPDRVLDPPTAAVWLRLEPDAQEPQPCFDVVLPAGCFFPDGQGGYTLSDNCRVSVKAVKEELAYFRDLTPLLERFSATLQQEKGAWQARIVTTFTEAVEQPDPCGITFTIGADGVANVPISTSDTKFRVGP